MQALEETVLKPIMWAVAWLMVGFHKVLSSIGMPADSGWTWALSIVGLTIVIRIILIPLFVKQIHASRRMQLIQPEMQKIQKKYKGKSDPESRQAMTQETMELYKRTGTNPFSSCLPILLQSPIFFALFRVLNDLSKIGNGTHAPIGGLTKHLASSAEGSTIFGASLSSSFMGSSDPQVKILTVVLIVLMAVSTFTSQHQLMRKNMPASALDNPMAKQQKWLIYLMPLFFAISGPNFPIGVLIYWVTTNVWSMGQQFYVIRRMPAPGSAAEKALEERRHKKGKEHIKFTVPGLHLGGDDGASDSDPAGAEQGATDASAPGRASGQRQQPKRKQRRRPPGSSSVGSTGADGAPSSPSALPGAATATADDGDAVTTGSPSTKATAVGGSGQRAQPSKKRKGQRSSSGGPGRGSQPR